MSSLIDDLLNIDEYFFFVFLCSYKLQCAVLEVFVKIEKFQNLHLLLSNFMLCHLYTIIIVNFFPYQFTKKLFFLFIEVLDSYCLNFSCSNFATVICSSCTLFGFTFCFISIYSFNNFLRGNKKALSIQSTRHASANRLIFYTSPVFAVYLGM